MAFNISNPIGTGTDAEMLEFVRAAIVEITLHGKSYKIGDREFTRADLNDLRALRNDLQASINAASSTTADRTNYAQRGRAL